MVYRYKYNSVHTCIATQVYMEEVCVQKHLPHDSNNFHVQSIFEFEYYLLLHNNQHLQTCQLLKAMKKNSDFQVIMTSAITYIFFKEITSTWKEGD